MSNEITILAYFGYFLSHLRFYLTKAKKAKNISSGGIFAENTKDIFFNSASARSECIDIN